MMMISGIGRNCHHRRSMRYSPNTRPNLNHRSILSRRAAGRSGCHIKDAPVAVGLSSPQGLVLVHLSMDGGAAP
jgi:hypothetical protein